MVRKNLPPKSQLSLRSQSTAGSHVQTSHTSQYPRLSRSRISTPPNNHIPKPTLKTANPPQASTNYKEAFALFDKRGNGRVALESLGDLLRACGQNPTLAEIRDLEKNVGGDCEPSPHPSMRESKHWADHAEFAVDFDSFQKVLNRPGGFRDPGEPEEYCRGFQVFDKDMTGFIGVGQLRYSTFIPSVFEGKEGGLWCVLCGWMLMVRFYSPDEFGGEDE